tara:strand:+ start:783 stop:1244 length:462 start_codon:yes stop_codon:yes gene_type:complete
MTHATRHARHATVEPVDVAEFALTAPTSIEEPTTVALSLPSDMGALINTLAKRLAIAPEDLLSFCVALGCGQAQAQGFARHDLPPQPEGGYVGSYVVSRDWYEHHALRAAELGCSVGVLAATTLRELAGWLGRSPKIRLRGRSLIEQGLTRVR